MNYDEFLDELLDEKMEEKTGFVVDTDTKADWCIEKIKSLQNETERFENIVKEKIMILNNSLDNLKNKTQKSVEYFERLLEEYALTVHLEFSKTGSQSYLLPSGKLVFKRQKEYIKDEERLLEYAKENKKYLKVEEKVNWKDLKNECKVVDGKLVDEDGVIVEGVIVETAYKFNIKHN